MNLPSQLRFHSMPSGTSPVRPDQYGLPSFLSLCCRPCAYHEPFRRACRRLSRCTGQISAPVSGCPQQPPGFPFRISNIAALGAHTPHSLLLRIRAAFSPVAGPPSIYGPHQVAQRGLDTCLGMRSATWMGTWQRHDFAPIAPSHTSWETHRMQNILDIIDSPACSDSTGRNTNLGVDIPQPIILGVGSILRMLVRT